MPPPRILLQLDGDTQASVFDAVVAIDSGVDHLLQYRGVTPDQVRELVHGAMFTRGPKDLNHTAVFVGGSDVAAGEAIFAEVSRCFFGPLRVSVMLDANGANTTAAAAVLAAARHLELRDAPAVVLAATGPVGQRVVRLLAREGARVRVGSRGFQRAEVICQRINELVPRATLEPFEIRTGEQAAAALEGAGLVVAAGAAGIQLLSQEVRAACSTLKVAIDLNAVPPAGIEGIDLADRAECRDGTVCYGAVGVGGTKMKIHKAAVGRLFTSNDVLLDAEEIFALGRALE